MIRHGSALASRGRALAFARIVLVACVVSASGAGCGSCGHSTQVAELVQARGTVQRDDEAAPTMFNAVAVGQAFFLGDAVHTTVGANATLEFSGGAGSLVLKSLSTVRFGRRRNGQAGTSVGVEAGEVEVEAGPGGMEFRTIDGLGTPRISPGTRIRITRRDGAQRVEVLVGTAVVERDGQAPMTIQQGQRLVVDIGGAVQVESVGANGEATPIDAGPLSSATDAGPPPDAGVVEAVDSGLGELAPNPGATSGDVYDVDVQRRAARVRGPNETDFHELPVGTGHVSSGSLLSVPAGGTVVVIGADGRATVVGAADVVVGRGGAIVDVETARHVSVEAAQGRDARVLVPGGTLVVRGSDGEAATDITPSGDTTRVTQRTGTADVHSAEGTQRLRRGQTAQIERAAPAEPGLPSITASPGRSDITMSAGDNGTIHNPSGGTAVRIRFPGCQGDGIVEVGGHNFRGATTYRGANQAIVSAPAGSTRYRVRCLSGDHVDTTTLATGTLRISRDAGTQAIPVRAPRSTVDADGHRWTVLYQTLLPEFTFQWPGAPSGPYVFRLEGGGSRVEVRSATPSTHFDSGRFDEGTYTFGWATADGSRRSPQTTLTIDFDNATPAAFIRQPSPQQALSGTVHVSGVALEGATVSVGGHNFSLDGQQRFTGDVPAPTDENCLAIRIAHPQRGVHYYLRCGGGGSH